VVCDWLRMLCYDLLCVISPFLQIIFTLIQGGENYSFLLILYEVGSQDSIDGLATGYGLDDQGVSLSPSRVKNFLFSTSSRPALGPTQPLIQWVLGVLSLGVKRQGCEADHSPPSSAEVKKMWIYTSTPR
jgi:hypothetical protein